MFLNACRILLVSCCAFAPAARGAEPPDPYHLRPPERQAIDRAIDRGVAWLVSRQDASGAFNSGDGHRACPVALTALAAWALAPADDTVFDASQRQAAMGFLLRHQQSDGGIYDPKRGLAIYTSGIAARALRALGDSEDQTTGDAIREVELFVDRGSAPESMLDAEQATREAQGLSGREAAQRALESGKAMSPNERRAMEFMARYGSRSPIRRPARTRIRGWRAPGPDLGPYTYDDLLQFIYKPLKPEHQMAIRMRQAARAYFTVDRNPDLTKRYGATGFPGGTQGLYYYYLSLARGLSVYAVPFITLSDGQTRDWVRELSGRLLELQRDDGSWVNEDGQWWEDEPVLVTSYALLALQPCRDAERSRVARPAKPT